jgi:hypothetical protein
LLLRQALRRLCLLLRSLLPLLLRYPRLLLFVRLLGRLERSLARDVRGNCCFAAQDTGVFGGGRLFGCLGLGLSDALGGMARVFLNLPEQCVRLVVALLQHNVVQPRLFVAVVEAAAYEKTREGREQPQHFSCGGRVTTAHVHPARPLVQRQLVVGGSNPSGRDVALADAQVPHFGLKDDVPVLDHVLAV